MKRFRDDQDIYNHKKAHLNNNPHFDSHNDSFTEYNSYFSYTHHKTNPRLARIFELCEEIDELILDLFTDVDEKKEKLISLMELRKKKLSSIYKTIKMGPIDSELGNELKFILQLFV